MPAAPLAAVVLVAFAQPRVHEPPAVSLGEATTIPFSMDFDKPVIEATINGQGPYPFILDTGCSPLLVMNDDLADELGLERGAGGAVGDPSNPQAVATNEIMIGSVRIGDAEFADVEGLSWADPGLFSGEGSPRGIIGLTLLGGVLTTFDFPNGKLTLAPGELARDDARVIAYTTENGIPAIPISVGGVECTAHLDTGAGSGVTLHIDEAEWLPLVDEPEIVGRGRTVNSEFNIYSATLDGEVAIGPVRMVNPKIGFRDGFEQAGVGCAAFAQTSLTFDQKNRLLRLDADGRRVVKQPEQRKRYGFMVGVSPDSNQMVIDRCIEGSVAERAGLREGDSIVAVNGTPIAELSGAERMRAFRASPITLTVERDGERLDVIMELDG